MSSPLRNKTIASYRRFQHRSRCWGLPPTQLFNRIAGLNLAPDAFWRSECNKPSKGQAALTCREIRWYVGIYRPILVLKERRFRQNTHAVNVRRTTKMLSCVSTVTTGRTLSVFRCLVLFFDTTNTGPTLSGLVTLVLCRHWVILSLWGFRKENSRNQCTGKGSRESYTRRWCRTVVWRRRWGYYFL